MELRCLQEDRCGTGAPKSPFPPSRPLCSRPWRAESAASSRSRACFDIFPGTCFIDKAFIIDYISGYIYPGARNSNSKSSSISIRRTIFIVFTFDHDHPRHQQEQQQYLQTVHQQLLLQLELFG